jgi:hypothetical protein
MHPSGVIPESAIMMVDSDCPDRHASIIPQESETVEKLPLLPNLGVRLKF